jgi:hypothetical protein
MVSAGFLNTLPYHYFFIELAVEGLPEIQTSSSNNKANSKGSSSRNVPALGEEMLSLTGDDAPGMEDDEEEEDEDSDNEDDGEVMTLCVSGFPVIMSHYNDNEAYPARPNTVAINIPLMQGFEDMEYNVTDGGWTLMVKYNWPQVMLNATKLQNTAVDKFDPSNVAMKHAIQSIVQEDENPALTLMIPLVYPCQALSKTWQDWLSSFESTDEGVTVSLLRITLKVADLNKSDEIKVILPRK